LWFGRWNYFALEKCFSTNPLTNIEVFQLLYCFFDCWLLLRRQTIPFFNLCTGSTPLLLSIFFIEHSNVDNVTLIVYVIPCLYFLAWDILGMASISHTSIYVNSSLSNFPCSIVVITPFTFAFEDSNAQRLERWYCKAYWWPFVQLEPFLN